MDEVRIRIRLEGIADRVEAIQKIENKQRQRNFPGFPPHNSSPPISQTELPVDMDCSNVKGGSGKRAKLVSKEEIERRKRDRRCLRWGL
jgi:hypothetical protein